MKTAKLSTVWGLLTMLLLGAMAAGQEERPQRGFVEFGARWSTGTVYGRPGLPFQPAIKTSKFGEYRDVRDGFFIRRFRLNLDNINSKYFVDLQSDRSLYRDQSYLATVGQWDRFKVQFRYNEIPHIYSNTTRTLYAQTGNGILTIPLLTRSTLQALAATPQANTIPITIKQQLVPGMNFIVPRIYRRMGTFLLAYDINPDTDVTVSFAREHQAGSRPIGLIFNSSPSAALTGGYGAEVPEPINYFNNTAKIAAEHVRERWGVQLGYTASYFQNETDTLTFDNPFRTTDCVAAVTPANCSNATQGPAKGVMDLYPDNHAHYVNFAGSFGLLKSLRLLASINAGWLRQNDPFVPYTSNSVLEAQTAPLPETSLHGEKQTLAMNYKFIERIGKQFEIKAAYRHYDYNNNTRMFEFTPVMGDFGAPNLANPDENDAFGYNRKNVEVTGNWYFGKKSSLKVGYEGEIMDRNHRDVEHSTENGLVAAVDATPFKQLSFRVSYRHSARNPERYEDDEALAISGDITNDSVFLRRFDETARVRNRADAQITFTPTDRLSFSGFGGTLQDDYNRRGGENNAAALNFVPGNARPYYLYGLLKDLSYNAGFDGDFILTNEVTVFAEYSWERYSKTMASRYRVPRTAAVAPGQPPPPLDCNTAIGHGCDTPNNDWGSTAREWVHIYTAGVDLQPWKNVFFDTYYTLSASKGHVNSRPFGDQTITTGPDRFLLFGTNAAVDYPETVNRTHEAVVDFKFKLTKNLTPKLEYRYQRFDNKDYQTSPMTPYMGCVSPLPPSPAVPGCPSVLIGTPAPFYPYFVVGDTSAARYLFLGADQPSYRSYYVAATLEYSF